MNYLLSEWNNVTLARLRFWVYIVLLLFQTEVVTEVNLESRIYKLKTPLQGGGGSGITFHMEENLFFSPHLICTSIPGETVFLPLKKKLRYCNSSILSEKPFLIFYPHFGLFLHIFLSANMKLIKNMLSCHSSRRMAYTQKEKMRSYCHPKVHILHPVI